MHDFIVSDRGILLRNLLVEIPKESNVDKDLLYLEFDDLEHLVGHICKHLKTEVFECSGKNKYIYYIYLTE